jgi:tetratricopeptide (TPR) repeat protein
MPRRLTSDIAHTAITDHRVLRRPASGSQTGAWESDAGNPLGSGEFPLRAFPSDRLNLENPELSRDFAVALSRLAQSAAADRAARLKLTRDALPLLDAAVKNFPEDTPSLQSRGYAFWQQNRKEQAWASFETALKLAPEDEATLTSAASLAADMGQHAKAIILWQRALTVNPWTARAHFELARLFVVREEWQKAADEAQAVLRLNPFHLEARKLLVVCYHQLGDKAHARAEFDHLLELNPPDPQSLHRWFDQQNR